MRRPEPGEYAAYYDGYINRTRGANFLQNLRDSADDLVHFLENLPAEKWNYAYAPEKWTVQQVVQHLIDCDLVFAYRAIWLARASGGTLPGFDENKWADATKSKTRSPQELMDEFISLRNFIVSTFKSFSESEMEVQGIASENQLKVNSIPFIIAGHTFHHLAILKERYL